MPITFDPTPTLDLEKPTRVDTSIPSELLVHFDPAVDLSDRQASRRLHKTKPAVLAIAQQVSTALFGSTESISHPFSHTLCTHATEPEWSLSFVLDHKVTRDGLNPVYLDIRAELVEGKVVLRVEEVTGEWRQEFNSDHESTLAKLREMAMECQAPREKARL